MKKHILEKKLAEGLSAEAHVLRELDAGHWKKASRIDEMMGIDFHSGNNLTVQIKADWRAGQTGNVFIETWSVDYRIRGWAYTCTADWLLYFIPEDGRLMYVKMDRLRAILPEWERRYRLAIVANVGYLTRGLLVPISEFKKIVNTTVSISPMNG